MTPLPWVLIGVALIFAWTPRWTRPDLYFAVTVQTDFAFTPQAKRILRQYWLELGLHTLVSLAVAGVVGFERSLAIGLAMGWELVGTTWAVARARRATEAYSARPSPVREAALTPERRSLPGGWPLALGPLAIVSATAIYATVAWDRLPERIAIHGGLHGADRWVERTPLHVYGLLLFLAALCGAFLLSALGIVRWSRSIAVTGERGRAEALFRRNIVYLLLVSPYLVVIPAVWMAFWPSSATVRPWPVAILVLTVIALLATIRMGQGGSRMAGRPEYEPPIGDHTPDEAWKLGQFYYNPSDPSLVVEKRFGIGYTLNFGNRWSWVLITAMLVPALLAIVLR